MDRFILFVSLGFLFSGSVNVSEWSTMNLRAAHLSDGKRNHTSSIIYNLTIYHSAPTYVVYVYAYTHNVGLCFKTTWYIQTMFIFRGIVAFKALQ